MTREHRWKVAPPPDPALVTQLSKEINVSETIARILIHRGIDSYDKAKNYFRPAFSLLHDPFLMDGMDRAVERLQRALDQQEKLLIFGDYDVDGTNGAAMLYLYFRHLGLSPGNIIYHIPDRIKEGYGISKEGIHRA